MRQSHGKRWSAGLLMVLGCCALNAGCHVAINLPASDDSGPLANAASAIALHAKDAGEDSYHGLGEPDGDKDAIQRCSATTQQDLSGPGGPPAPGGPACGPQSRAVPRELDKVSLPEYIIEPPDVLLIETVHGTPLSPYRIESLDVLQIQVPEAQPVEPIAGQFVVGPEGTVNLGLSYGSVPVAGLTVDAAREAITAQLKRVLTDPRAVVCLAQGKGARQLVHGEHRVQPDGTVSLGIYGDVYVAGMNRSQARSLIEHQLAQYLQDPQVNVDVLGCNSKVYYVIFDGGGCGQRVWRLPITGNETVLDAIGLTNGLPAVSSKRKIWVARPAPAGHPCDQVLPVDWRAITEGGSTATNYQLLPGDRVYIKADPWVWFHNTVAKLLSQSDHMLGFTLVTGP